MSRRKPDWRRLYLDMKWDRDCLQVEAETAAERELAALREVARSHEMRAKDEDRHAEERGALQRRIEELENDPRHS